MDTGSGWRRRRKFFLKSDRLKAFELFVAKKREVFAGDFFFVLDFVDIGFAVNFALM